MFKKLASIALAALMVTGTAAIAGAAETDEAVAATAEENAVSANDNSEVGANAGSDTGAGSKIYFEVPSWWHNYKKVLLYLYNMDDGTKLIKWQANKGKMTEESDGRYSYDLEAKGFDLKDGTNYACIFLTDTGAQTCDLMIGKDVYGDTAVCTGENDKIENTADSHKSNYRVKWKNANPSRWGVPLAITSIGNIVGDSLKPGYSKYDLFVSFLKDKGTQGIDNALKFNGKSVQQTIDDTAATLGLKKDDVKSALADSGRSDLKWDESKSSLSDGASDDAKQKQGGGSSTPGSSSSSNGSSSDGSSSGSSSSGGSSSGSSSSGGSSSGGSSSGGSSSGGGSSSSGGGSSSAGGSTGSVTSGQETTIFFVFGGVMLAAAGVIFLARKKREF